MPSISINTNLSSLIAQQSLKQSSNKLNQAVERMSTGFKINHAKDNAANYSISTNMTTKIGAYQVAEDNVAMGLDLLSTANGSLDQISDKLSRLRELGVQTTNGTYGNQSMKAINAEANAIIDEIEKILNTSEYNGINVFKGQVVNAESSNFMKDIDRRDTSKMTTLESVDISQKLNSGTYSISTPEELAKLATMTNNGLIGADTEFVLASDIDLSSYTNWIPIGTASEHSKKFHGNFDGNGYIISNLTISSKVSNSNGLFGTTYCAEIKNLGIVNANISVVSNYVGILLGLAGGTSVSNCYAEGSISGGWGNLGGLCGGLSYSQVLDSYSNASVSGSGRNIGVFIGHISDKMLVQNCFSEGSATTTNAKGYLGGFAGSSNIDSVIKNSYSSATTSGSGPCINDFVGNPLGEILDCGKEDSLSYGAKIFSYISNLNLQVGINSELSSQILTDLEVSIDGLQFLRQTGKSITKETITEVDVILNKISKKQTELGSLQNRLESALDEISTQYENLVSSRSTLRDADISEVSSEYIRQQILQEASATLLATANQNPSIALQLL